MLLPVFRITGYRATSSPSTTTEEESPGAILVELSLASSVLLAAADSSLSAEYVNTPKLYNPQQQFLGQNVWKK